jgi:hypothetical protein
MSWTESRAFSKVKQTRTKGEKVMKEHHAIGFFANACFNCASLPEKVSLFFCRVQHQVENGRKKRFRDEARDLTSALQPQFVRS